MCIRDRIKGQTNELIEDAFIESLNGDEKMDKLIDELIDDRFDLLATVCNYPMDKDGKQIREHFNSIKSKLNTSVSSYSKKIGRVS